MDGQILESRVEQRIMIKSAMNCCDKKEYLEMLKYLVEKDSFNYKIKTNYSKKIGHRIKILYGDDSWENGGRLGLWTRYINGNLSIWLPYNSPKYKELER